MSKLLSCLLSLLTFAFFSAYATTVQKIDTVSVAVKQFDVVSLEKYKADENFNYTTTPKKDRGGSLFSYLFAEFLEKLFSTQIAGISMYDVVAFALILFAAVMLVMQVFKIKSTSMFSKDPVKIASFTAESENIHQASFDKMIEDAQTKGNYRLAVRMLYLKTLKVLSETGLINWQKNKTNFEYYYELRGENIRDEFHSLTLIFESAWYGHYEISADDFSANVLSFNRFLMLIRKH